MRKTDSRRRAVIQALAATFAAGPSFSFGQNSPRQDIGASATSSVARISGDVSVNGQPVSATTKITSTSVIKTGDKSEFVFVVGTQAIAVRENSILHITTHDAQKSSVLVGALRVITGAISSVSRNSDMALTTLSATIGIRGTGFHVECTADKTYFCTCYGTTRVASTSDPKGVQTVRSMHHDHPLYITGKGPKNSRLAEADFIGHTDEELIYLENLVGRKPPFLT